MYDESIDVSDAEEVATPPSSVSEPKSKSANPQMNKSSVQDDGSQAKGNQLNMPVGDRRQAMLRSSAHHRVSDQSDDDEEDDIDEDDDDVKAANLGCYNPSEFDHLTVSPEVKELFQNITKYTPQKIDLEYKLRPFVPDFIPAVGDIDAFLKVVRPDGKPDNVGLLILDEPCAAQSEPAVLHLQLRALTKQSSAKAMVVKQVPDAEKNVKEIDRWIKDISDLHRSKPPPTVNYSRPMPDVDTLLQEWPQEVENSLNRVGLPISQLNTDLTNYVDIICSLMDIPTYESRIQALHVLFSLYIAVQNAKQGNEDSASRVVSV